MENVPNRNRNEDVMRNIMIIALVCGLVLALMAVSYVDDLHYQHIYFKSVFIENGIMPVFKTIDLSMIGKNNNTNLY